MFNLIIIGASELQLPLIIRAGELGYATHVFAWKKGSTGLDKMTKFYDIDIKDIDKIYEIAKKLNPVGVCSIGSDLANITVQKLAAKFDLPCNTNKCINVTTNKFNMRKELLRNGISCPKFIVTDNLEPNIKGMEFPLIVKPTDRSGSRAITKLETNVGLKFAIKRALNVSFEKKAIIEEYISGNEFSAECISQNGEHFLLNVTKKFTSGEPNFIETGHLEPALLSNNDIEIIKENIFKALDSLDIKLGASHSEFKYDEIHKKVSIIEIGSRMGGDFIGSSLVRYSTGYDFLKMVIDCAVGKPISLKRNLRPIYPFVCVKYCFNINDINFVKSISKENIIAIDVDEKLANKDFTVIDSSSRMGYSIMHFDKKEKALEVLNYDSSFRS